MDNFHVYDTGRPKSWWREKLGFVSIFVIDEGEWEPLEFNHFGFSIRGKITKSHYEWHWLPFGNKRRILFSVTLWFILVLFTLQTAWSVYTNNNVFIFPLIGLWLWPFLLNEVERKV